MNVVGFVGFAGSGKGTASRALISAGWTPLAFADALKDCVCAVFGWDRAMMEGDTPESRAWREQVDQWWAKRLGMPNFTPRLAMQMVGTDAMRTHFHIDVWVLALERRLTILSKSPVVITDVRHPNEIRLIRRLGGKMYRVRRGSDPAWWDVAVEACRGSTNARVNMQETYGVHESEWAWVDEKLDGTIENDGSIDDLLLKVRSLTQ